MLNSEQKILGLIAHLGIFLGLPVLAPLLVFLLSRDSIVKNQAKEALVFQIALIVLGFIASILIIILIGIPILIVLGVIAVIFPIVAAVEFYQKGYYSYPVTGKLFKTL